MAAMVLAAAMALTTVTSAFAASSPGKDTPVAPTTKPGDVITGKADGTAGDNTDMTGVVNTNGGVTITKASNSGSTLDISSYMVTNKGEAFDVDVVATGSISGKKYSKITLGTKASTTFQKKIVKGKKANKSKKIIITTRTNETGKLKASNFHKQAFKGFKGKIIVRKKAMTKKQFKKLVKKLRKGGFKGKIVRRG
jgi:hypothetical protein